MNDLNSALERLEHAVQRVRMGTSRLSNDVNDLANDVRASAESVRSHTANHALMMNSSTSPPPPSSSATASTTSFSLPIPNAVSDESSSLSPTIAATAVEETAAVHIEGENQEVEGEERRTREDLAVNASLQHEQHAQVSLSDERGEEEESQPDLGSNTSVIPPTPSSPPPPSPSLLAPRPVTSSPSSSSSSTSFTYVRYSTSPALREAAVSGYTGLVRSPLSVAADVDPFQVRQPGYSLSSGDGSISMLRDTERGRSVVASSALLQSLALTALSEVIQASLAGATAAGGGGGGGGGGGTTGDDENE